jgi:endoglucanase
MGRRHKPVGEPQCDESGIVIGWAHLRSPARPAASSAGPTTEEGSVTNRLIPLFHPERRVAPRKDRRRVGYLRALAVLSITIASLGRVAWAEPFRVISVRGNELVADGRSWVPHGVNVAGLLAARDWPYTKFVMAGQHWGPREIDAIKAYGANVVRFLVSQPGLDPESPLYTPGYVGRITRAVRAVRAAGIAVILCPQWERTSGMTGLSSMPNDSTLRVWRILAPIFASDPGVIYELFNEPVARGEPRLQAWASWDRLFQQLIYDVRTMATKNLIVADGMWRRLNLRAVEGLSDPAGRLAFAIHPYPRDARNDAAAWDRRFGAVALRYPVILTEWNSTNRWSCLANTPTMVQEFLSYLYQRRIGIIGWVFDIPGSLVKDYSFEPTTYDNFYCGSPGFQGAGKVLNQYFRSFDAQ